jgi:hypothetical protein
MPAFLGPGADNPIAWCNFYRKGGFKTLLTTSGAYFGIFVALIFLTVRLEPRSATNTYAGWATGFLALQFLFMVIIGAGRVTNTIRVDLSSGMIESLRMMPLPAGHAVAGYLTSTAASLVGFFAANFVLGLVVTALADLPAGRWVMANLILLAFAVFVWTIAAFLAFVVNNAAVVMVLVSFVGIFGNSGVLMVAPGLIVPAGPLVGGTIFNLRGAQTEFAAPLVLSLAAQVIVGAIFFAGAARKYRRPEALALGAWLGLGLLLAVIGISLLAILRPEGLLPGFIARQIERTNGVVPFCGSAVLAMMVALIPLCSFARAHAGWLRGRAEDPTVRRTVPPLAAAAVIVAAVLALMTLAHPAQPSAARLACVGAAMLGFCVSVIHVAAWFYRSVDNAKIILGIWVGVYCLMPLGMDFFIARASERVYDEPMLGVAATFSPVGLLIESATQPEADLRVGAAFHVLIPLLPMGIYARRDRRRTGGVPRSDGVTGR